MTVAASAAMVEEGSRGRENTSLIPTETTSGNRSFIASRAGRDGRDWAGEKPVVIAWTVLARDRARREAG